ncbi:MAG: hypothetical protein ACWGNB_09910 [Thiogranum sp.]|jgi:hypothetical protein
MSSDTENPDRNGIPVLDNPLDLDQLDKRTTAAPLPDLTDHELVARLLQNAAVQSVLDDMSEDLQKLVSWKIEELLKEQFTLLIRQAAAESAPKLAEDIRTQLQLALPGLLADMLALARRNGQGE